MRKIMCKKMRKIMRKTMELLLWTSIKRLLQ